MTRSGGSYNAEKGRGGELGTGGKVARALSAKGILRQLTPCLPDILGRL
jgi:hypothetical protein